MKNKSLLMLIALISINLNIKSMDSHELIGEKDDYEELLSKDDSAIEKPKEIAHIAFLPGKAYAGIKEGIIPYAFTNERSPEGHIMRVPRYMYKQREYHPEMGQPEEAIPNKRQKLTHLSRPSVAARVIVASKIANSYQEESKKNSEVSIKPLDIKKYACTEDGCTKSYDSMRGLKNHIKAVHEGQRYACDEAGCGKSYSLKGSLKTHIKKEHLK